jgi:hypothetical protein
MTVLAAGPFGFRDERSFELDNPTERAVPGVGF